MALTHERHMNHLFNAPEELGYDDAELDALEFNANEMYAQHCQSEHELKTEQQDMADASNWEQDELAIIRAEREYGLAGYDSYEAALEAFDQEYPNIVVHDEQAASDNQCICNDCIGLFDCGCVYPAVCEHCDIPF